jgi:hypothetical protein
MTISKRARAAAAAGRDAHVAIANARAAALAPTIAEIRASGITTLNGIATALNARKVRTPTGRKKWQVTQVRRVLARLKV